MGKGGLTRRARGRLDSHRQNGLFHSLGFCPFRGRVSSLQPPVTQRARGPFGRLRTARLDSHRQIGIFVASGFLRFVSESRPASRRPAPCSGVSRQRAPGLTQAVGAPSEAWRFLQGESPY
jgi:hypothetical protein